MNINEYSWILSYWPNWRWEEGLYWKGQGGGLVWDYPQEYLVVLKDKKYFPFVTCEMTQPFLRYLLDPKEVQQGMEFYNKFYE